MAFMADSCRTIDGDGGPEIPMPEIADTDGLGFGATWFPSSEDPVGLTALADCVAVASPPVSPALMVLLPSKSTISR
eukprot:CAMPEP_0172640614 /NCGR_PEP_ID=MMETSP1068-20121228/223791_1 /TAXON_ID=35684 /ORGANISM="Pseudopedinella elastica, Strain CCMP716" /LENGTH=76 /DNA_ID=CAMNT_0013454027 /DNA_START=32 /DNA_END=262 /DNA_ORIENTATION=-